MNRNEFYLKISDILAEDDIIHLDRDLSDVPGWDSLGQIAVFAFLDEEFSVQPETGFLSKCKTLKDVEDLVKDKITA